MISSTLASRQPNRIAQRLYSPTQHAPRQASSDKARFLTDYTRGVENYQSSLRQYQDSVGNWQNEEERNKARAKFDAATSYLTNMAAKVEETTKSGEGTKTIEEINKISTQIKNIENLNISQEEYNQQMKEYIDALNIVNDKFQYYSFYNFDKDTGDISEINEQPVDWNQVIGIDNPYGSDMKTIMPVTFVTPELSEEEKTKRILNRYKSGELDEYFKKNPYAKQKVDDYIYTNIVDKEKKDVEQSLLKLNESASIFKETVNESFDPTMYSSSFNKISEQVEQRKSKQQEEYIKAKEEEKDWADTQIEYNTQFQTQLESLNLIGMDYGDRYWKIQEFTGQNENLITNSLKNSNEYQYLINNMEKRGQDLTGLGYDIEAMKNDSTYIKTYDNAGNLLSISKPKTYFYTDYDYDEDDSKKRGKTYFMPYTLNFDATGKLLSETMYAKYSYREKDERDRGDDGWESFGYEDNKLYNLANVQYEDGNIKNLEKTGTYRTGERRTKEYGEYQTRSGKDTWGQTYEEDYKMRDTYKSKKLEFTDGKLQREQQWTPWLREYEKNKEYTTYNKKEKLEKSEDYKRYEIGQTVDRTWSDSGISTTAWALPHAGVQRNYKYNAPKQSSAKFTITPSNMFGTANNKLKPGEREIVVMRDASGKLQKKSQKVNGQTIYMRDSQGKTMNTYALRLPGNNNYNRALSLKYPGVGFANDVFPSGGSKTYDTFYFFK